ncbi:AAA family ATPase [Paenibacillus sp. FSL F4-0236]|uniref:AAA family ATPase n=1 Tax=Paenibacillus sp. FSL F4-0236 TaxID=2954731 RepID=UPI0030F759F5
MIIWINGAFGAGKTETAYELHRRLPDSFVYDPENAGYYIRANIPDVMTKSDFQDYYLWREINHSMLKYIASEYRGTIIVPMTIVNPEYWMDIAGNLINEGLEVHHFTLCASRETLLKRLGGRGERNDSWAVQQIDRCLTGLNKDVFKDHLDTNNLTTLGVVKMIASKLDITLTPIIEEK